MDRPTTRIVAARVALMALTIASLAIAVTPTACAQGDVAPNTTPGHAASARPVTTLEQVLAAWDQRESRLRTFRASWIHERTYTKYWANCHVPSARDAYVTLRFGESVLLLDGDRLRFDSGAVDSSGDAVQFDGDQKLDEFGRGAHDDARRVFRDERIRYDAGRPRVDPRESRPSAWPRNLRGFTTVFDGEHSVQLMREDRGEFPEAYLFAGPEDRFRESLHYLPLIASVRPSWLELSSENCRIASTTESIQGRECCILIDETGLHREFWLDIERDFVPLSIRMDCDVLGARMKNQFDIDYFEDADGRWLPSGWTTVFLDNYGLREQSAPATVIEAAANMPIARSEFEVDFPEGTWVYDETRRAHSIMAADGTAVPISEGELQQGLTHAELAARGTLRGAVGAVAKFVKQSLWARLVLIGLLAVGLAAWARRKTTRASAGKEAINA